MKSKQKDGKQRATDSNSASRQAGNQGSGSVARPDSQGGSLDRHDEVNRRVRGEVNRVSSNRSGSRNR
ncbi:MAG: hypothetical protein V4724_40940 [Pseudomonadota bacterium]